LDAVGAKTNWIALTPNKMVSEAGIKLTSDKEQVISTDKDPADGKDTYRITVKTGLKGITGFRLEAVPMDKLPGRGPGRGADGNFVLTEFSIEDSSAIRIPVTAASATFEAADFPATAALDGNHETNNGWSIRGVTGCRQAIYFTTAPISTAVESAFTFVLQQASGSNQVLGRFRLAATTNSTAISAPKIALPSPEIAEVLKIPPEKRTPEQRDKLAEFHQSTAPELIDIRGRFMAASRAHAGFEATVPRCLVSVVSEQPRIVRILPRGNWMNESGEVVQPALPAYLTASLKREEHGKLNRLDLAEWLVSRDNPLTARVFVNRLWKQFFGVGLSKVMDDFGQQGEPPVNPELLDWLACEFMDSGWDVKHMVRLIVTSQTYKQVSTASKALQGRDPYNRELARQSRWRIDAELVRDDALSIAGLLMPKVGGPSVKPYQPDGYWENLNFPTRTYVADTGESQYRRGLYTWWQRSFLHPSLVAFDAPTREECAAERNRSNIPQQALVLLNDPTYVEAARAFAARIVKESGSDTNARIRWAWQQALSRLPRADEMDTVRALLAKHLAEYKQDPNSAEALLKVGLSPAPADLDAIELAAWTSVARVILNLHETITRS